MMTQYELLYIIPATFTDEDVGGVENTVKALLEKHGATVETTTRLGKFKLAYEIKKVRHGHFVLVRFSADGTALAAIDMALRISADVLRHLVLRADEAGGDKFEMIQFTEVNLDAKGDARDERPRHRAPEATKLAEDVKPKEAVAAAPELSAEELEKKIAAALEEKT